MSKHRPSYRRRILYEIASSLEAMAPAFSDEMQVKAMLYAAIQCRAAGDLRESMFWAAARQPKGGK